MPCDWIFEQFCAVQKAGVTSVLLWTKEQRPSQGEVSRAQGWNRQLDAGPECRFPDPQKQFPLSLRLVLEWEAGIRCDLSPAASCTSSQPPRQTATCSNQPAHQPTTSGQLLAFPHPFSSPSLSLFPSSLISLFSSFCLTPYFFPSRPVPPHPHLVHRLLALAWG